MSVTAPSHPRCAVVDNFRAVFIFEVSPRSISSRSGIDISMNFEDREDKDGVRVTWNNVPKSKLQNQRNIVPLATLYTPLNNKSRITCLDATSISRCRQCKAFLNPYITINQQTPDIWYCQFCSFGNRLSLSETGTYPTSIQPEFSTVEYKTGRESRLPPIFWYVVDTCFEGEDIEDAFGSLRELLILSISLLPSNCLVGFVSFGKHVQLHDLLNPHKSYFFNGDKEYSSEQVQKILGLNSSGLGNSSILSSLAQRFLQPVQIAEYQLCSVLENLTNNVFPHNSARDRAERSTGCAINVTSLIIEAILGKGNSSGGHIMCFVGGATTYGPGRIVGLPLKEPMRSHHDIEKSIASTLPNILNGATKVDSLLFKTATTFYGKIAKILVTLGISCDLFVGSYDQVGLYEMDEVSSKTGGEVVMCDSFNTSMFKQSFIRFFRRIDDEEYSDLDMAFNATLECRTTQDLQIQGLVGHASALPLRKDKFIEASILLQRLGEGGTNAWKLCSVNPQSTYAVYFDKLDSPQIGYAFIQFTFHYQHPTGELRLRVTTIPLPVIADSDAQNLELLFDQEAAVVAIARSAIVKLSTNILSGEKNSFSQADVVKHLDKLLIDFCTRFGVYQKGVINSFRLSSNYAMLPQFMYHFRRSQFIRLFNNSPDETSYVRHLFLHEDTNNGLIMIQPSLLSYDIDTFGTQDENGEIIDDPEPVLLDSVSLGHNKILLLDTFFHILIHHGMTISQWRKANYHNMEGYEHFKEFLEAPKREAMEILMDRFPLPRFIDCDEGGSQARFLMAKLNPSTSYSSNPNQTHGLNSDVLTDDTSLQLFMDQIQCIVVGTK